jgi:hypothetical protein
MESACVVCAVASSLLCSRCKAVRYCSKEHQKADWKTHKTHCCNVGAAASPGISQTSSSLNPDYHDASSSPPAPVNRSEFLRNGIFLPIEDLLLTRLPSDYPSSFRPSSKNYVSDGKLHVSSSQPLFTWGVNTCLLVIVWGSDSVCLLHLSGWNADGNPFAGETVNLAAALPPGFKFVKGCLLPGQNIDPATLGYKLMGGGEGGRVLAKLMVEKVFHNAPDWHLRFSVLRGLKAHHVIRASVKDQKLEVFVNPGVPKMPDGEQQCPVS